MGISEGWWQGAECFLCWCACAWQWWEVRRHKCKLAEQYSSAGQASTGKGKAPAAQVQAGTRGKKRPREEGDSHEVQGLATGGGGKKHKTCRVS